MGAGLIDDFIGNILSVPFCPYHFVQCHFVRIPLCPYRFVRYHFVLEPAQVMWTVLLQSCEQSTKLWLEGNVVSELLPRT